MIKQLNLLTKRKYLIVCLLIFGFGTILAQIKSDSITCIKSKRKFSFIQNGKVLSYHQLKTILAGKPESALEMQEAKKLNRAASFISFTAGILIGLTYQGVIDGHYQNAIPLGASLLFILYTVPISKDVNHHIEKAVLLYNASLRKT